MLKVVRVAVAQREGVAARVRALVGDLGVCIAGVRVVDPGDIIVVLFLRLGQSVSARLRDW